MVKAWCSWERDREREHEGKHIDDENIYIENKCIIHCLSLIHAITRPTWGAGVSDEILGEAKLEGEPSKKWEQSVYADPMPNPAPKATDAQRVTGLPGLNLRLLIWEGYKHQLKNQQTYHTSFQNARAKVISKRTCKETFPNITWATDLIFFPSVSWFQQKPE